MNESQRDQKRKNPNANIKTLRPLNVPSTEDAHRTVPMKRTFNTIIERLTERLQAPLPGWEAQQRMATEMHRQYRLKPKPNARRAAVLMLLYPHEQFTYLPLIVRPTYEGVHSGQVALPGGKVEEVDRTLIDTARRETAEEIGVLVEEKQVLGSLSELYIPPSNIIVTPVVAFTSARLTYRLQPSEVAAVLDIRLSDLIDKAHQRTVRVSSFGGYTFDAPSYVVNERVIWGATAMMLSELLWVLE